MYCIWYIELFWKCKLGMKWFWFELEEKKQNFSGLTATGRPDWFWCIRTGRPVTAGENFSGFSLNPVLARG